MKRFTHLALVLFSVFLIGCASHRAPTGPPLATQLDSILTRNEQADKSIVAARVIDPETGQTLYARNIDRPMMPASNMKLLTTATAVDLFGPAHTFKTYLAVDGDDLWVIGTGDPATGDPAIAKKREQPPTAMFDDWAKALKARGLTSFRGNLVYYDGALEALQIHPSWSRGYITDWYAAPVAGLNFNDNCVDITAYPGATDGDPARLEVVPVTDSIKIINQSHTGPSTRSARESMDVTREKSADVLTVTGPCTRKTELSSKAVTDPGRIFADALRVHLRSQGITIAGEIRKSPVPLGDNVEPPAAKLVATHQTPFVDLLTRLNKNSQNLFAEALSKLAGQAFEENRGVYAPGSWEGGANAVRAFLRKYRIDDTDLKIAEGSGLSRDNRVTARLVSDLLLTMYNHPHYAFFRNSLPVSGTDGTISKRMLDIKGRVYAKTGYIGGVRALSGYVKTDSGKWLIFSIIFNDIPGGVKPYEAIQDDAVRAMYHCDPALWTAPPATQPAR